MITRNERKSPTSPHAGRGLWRRLAGVAVALAVTVAGLVTITATAQAAVQNHTPATYNMDGADAGAKWHSEVIRLTRHHDVLALQEAGARPNMGHGTVVANDGHRRVMLYRWNAGPHDRPVHRNVFYLQTDTNPNAPNGGRVNLAIVTQHDVADLHHDVYIVRPTRAYPHGRPAFGIRIGDTIFFTYHALRGGEDSEAMLEQMATVARRAGVRAGHEHGYQWAVLGDFNRRPDRLDVPAGSHIYRPFRPTHVHGGELDYMVAHRPGQDRIPNWNGRVQHAMGSDHFPVEFGPFPLEGGAGHPDLTWDFSPHNGSVAERNYNRMINTLRTSGGSHNVENGVDMTSTDRDRVLTERVNLGESSMTLFFSAHDTRLRGWDDGTRCFQFADWALDSVLHRRSCIHLLNDGDYKTLRHLAGSDPEASQRRLSAARIHGALEDLAGRDSSLRSTARAVLTLSTAITEAAHFGAVSAVTMRTIGDKNPHDIHHINDTEFALYNDWQDISHFARNAHDDPKHTPPLVLHDIHPIVTLRTFKDAKNFVALISSRGV
jgi:hypothetical protein